MCSESKWLIDIQSDGVLIKRFGDDNQTLEVYRKFSLAEATVSVCAIIQGFLPPRDFRHRDTLAD